MRRDTMQSSDRPHGVIAVLREPDRVGVPSLDVRPSGRPASTISQIRRIDRLLQGRARVCIVPAVEYLAKPFQLLTSRIVLRTQM